MENEVGRLYWPCVEQSRKSAPLIARTYDAHLTPPSPMPKPLVFGYLDGLKRINFLRRRKKMTKAYVASDGTRLCKCGTPLAKRRRMCDECRDRSHRKSCKRSAAKWQKKNRRVVKLKCPLVVASCPMMAGDYGENLTAPLGVFIPRILGDLERLKRLLECFMEGKGK